MLNDGVVQSRVVGKYRFVPISAYFGRFRENKTKVNSI